MKSLSLAFVVSALLSFPAQALDLSFDVGITLEEKLEARMSDLNKKISDALESGRITREEAQAFRREHKDLVELSAVYKASEKTLNDAEILELGRVLDKLSFQIVATMRDCAPWVGVSSDAIQVAEDSVRTAASRPYD